MEKASLIPVLLLLVLLPGFLVAANVYGTVFNEDLQPSRAAVQINTTPGQQLITTDGKYQFGVPAGTYRLAAVGDNSSAEKILTIQTDGEFRIDLILLPGVPPEDAVLADLLDVPGISEPAANPPASSVPWIPLAVIGALLLIIAAAYVFRSRLPAIGNRSAPPTSSAPPASEPVAPQAPASVPPASNRIFTADQNKVMQALASFGNRASQKDLRKALNYWSEAKVSMELTELEDLGAIQKIKKGRGNIIRKG